MREFTYSTTEGDLSWIEGGGFTGAVRMVERAEQLVRDGLVVPLTPTGPDVPASTSEFVGAYAVAGVVAREFAELLWGDGAVGFVGSAPRLGPAVEGAVY